MVVAVDVCVLGPVEVRGAAALFRRSAALELVVYLAFHRRPVRHGEWALALWPDRSVSTSTIYSTSSDARRALGRDGAGDERLPRNGGHLVLGGDVGTDVARFEKLVSSGRPADLVDAMALVRGPIFAGLRRTDWAVFDGTESSLQSLVADTALRAADLLVGLGRAGEAERMVRRALLACPYDERLYRSLLAPPPRRATGSAYAPPWLRFSPWRETRSQPPGRRRHVPAHPSFPASTPTPPPSITSSWAPHPPPEGVSPGCRIAFLWPEATRDDRSPAPRRRAAERPTAGRCP